ncbi:MAG: hypothetical protein WCG78_05885, partial [Candidatus Omnitrophota bacterium]
MISTICLALLLLLQQGTAGYCAEVLMKHHGSIVDGRWSREKKIVSAIDYRLLTALRPAAVEERQVLPARLCNLPETEAILYLDRFSRYLPVGSNPWLDAAIPRARHVLSAGKERLLEFALGCMPREGPSVGAVHELQYCLLKMTEDFEHRYHVSGFPGLVTTSSGQFLLSTRTYRYYAYADEMIDMLGNNTNALALYLVYEPLLHDLLRFYEPAQARSIMAFFVNEIVPDGTERLREIFAAARRYKKMINGLPENMFSGLYADQVICLRNNMLDRPRGQIAMPVYELTTLPESMRGEVDRMLAAMETPDKTFHDDLIGEMRAFLADGSIPFARQAGSWRVRFIIRGNRQGSGRCIDGIVETRMNGDVFEIKTIEKNPESWDRYRDAAYPPIEPISGPDLRVLVGHTRQLVRLALHNDFLGNSAAHFFMLRTRPIPGLAREGIRIDEKYNRDFAQMYLGAASRKTYYQLFKAAKQGDEGARTILANLRAFKAGIPAASGPASLVRGEDTAGRAVLRSLAFAEQERELISSSEYPSWVLRSMERARAHLTRIRRNARVIVEEMTGAGFELDQNCLAHLDDAVGRWESLIVEGASLERLNGFIDAFETFYHRGLNTNYDRWVKTAEDDDTFYYARTGQPAWMRAELIVKAAKHVEALKPGLDEAFNRMVEQVNGLTAYLVVDYRGGLTSFGEMTRKQDFRDSERKLHKRGFDPVLARQHLAAAAKKRALKELDQRYGTRLPLTKEITGALAEDIAWYFYPEFARRFVSVEVDRARVEAISIAFRVRDHSDKGALLVELGDIIDRTYIPDGHPGAETEAEQAALLETRQQAQRILLAECDKVGDRSALLEKVVRWMSCETHFVWWDALLRLFGTLADRPENLAQLRTLYQGQGTHNLNVALQVVAVYTQVMTNIHLEQRDKLAEEELRDVIGQVEALAAVVHQPFISHRLTLFMRYIRMHWQHWDNLAGNRHAVELLKGGPRTFVFGLFWSKLDPDLPKPPSEYVAEREEGGAFLRFQDILRHLIERMAAVRGAAAPVRSPRPGNGGADVLRPLAAGDR